MKLLLLFICFLVNFSVFGQTVDTPKIPLTATDVKGFIPEGWDMLMEGKGDLNEYGSKDLVFVIQKIGTEFDAVYYHELPRILVIAFQQPPSSNYEVQLIKKDFILLASEGGVYGDPFEYISIDNDGILCIEFYGGSSWHWVEKYKFRYEESHFRLIGVDLIRFHNIGGETDDWSYNLLTGKAKKQNYNMFDDTAKRKENWFKINPPTGKLYLKDLPKALEWDFFKPDKFIPLD